MIGAGARLGLSALDVVRTFGLRALGKAAAPLYATTRARLVTFAVLGLVTSFLLAVVAPAWSIAVGTLGLGVLHVISDVRYLVVRRGLARRASVYVAVAAATLATALGYGLRGALAGALLAVPFARASVGRRLAVLGVGALLVAVAYVTRSRIDYVYLHGHNVVGLVFLALLARGQGRAREGVVLLAIFVALSVVLVAPVGDSLVVAAGGTFRAPAALPFGDLVMQLSPPELYGVGLGLVPFFAFAQSFHYVVWLRLVPEVDRDLVRPRSFRQSGRALARDLGPWVVGAFAVGALVFAVWGLVDVVAARLAYLRSALFHGYIELVVLALYACEGRTSADAGRDRRAGPPT